VAYNKKEHLESNIEAIALAFFMEKNGVDLTNDAREVLEKYSGFGGLKCILNPAENESDKKYWTKSEIELFPLVQNLHNLLRENSVSETEYKRYFDSLRNSVMTSFYTPKEIVNVISSALKRAGVEPKYMLEPSAGTGVFADAFRSECPLLETT
jgi:type I restriction-modification system DNA methylase subunit